MWGQFQRYVSNSHNSIAKHLIIRLKSRVRTWVSISPNKIYKWLMGSLIIRKVQIKLQWDITAHLPKWILLKKNQSSNSKKTASKNKIRMWRNWNLCTLLVRMQISLVFNCLPSFQVSMKLYHAIFSSQVFWAPLDWDISSHSFVFYDIGSFEYRSGVL